MNGVKKGVKFILDYMLILNDAKIDLTSFRCCSDESLHYLELYQVSERIEKD